MEAFSFLLDAQAYAGQYAQAYASQYAKSYARKFAKASTSPCGHSRLKALCYNNTAYNNTAYNSTALAPPLTKVSALSKNTSYFAAIDCL